MFVSLSLTSLEKNYMQIEREGLAVVYKLSRLRQYLLGRKFKLVTDNKPLSHVLANPLPGLASTKVQQWVLQQFEVKYEVEVRRSHQTPVTDWFSRVPKATPITEGDKEDEMKVC